MDLFQKCTGFTRAREVEAQGFYPYFIPIGKNLGTEVEIDGRRLIMAGSNNYLGLTQHPEVLAAAHDAIDRYGSSCSGSRFLNGTLELHQELERRLAIFLRRDAALCFSTGFQTNLGVLSCLCGKGDAVFTDRENHASILDGCRLGFADIRKFRHNDLADLEQQLETGARDSARGLLVAIDGVYSMMGDFADLRGICALAKHYGARVLVDEAHAVGVLGPNGRGSAEHLGVEDDVDLIVGTFSKSFASLGGFVAGDEQVIHYIQHHARSLIFSAAIHPAAAAAALAALDLMERDASLREQVQHNASYVRSALQRLGFDVGASQTPILPILVRDQSRMFALWKALFDGGVFTNPVTSPGVPPGMELIRTSYMATHTRTQLDQVIDVFRAAGQKTGLIPAGARAELARGEAGLG